MATFRGDEFYDILVSRKTPSGTGWITHSTIFRRDNHKPVAAFVGERASISSAKQAALEEARRHLASLSKPEDWLGEPEDSADQA